ncbi:hypothetical protein N0V90_012378 [Kalmusia sp. IMI 367209]|nr:hypothetical protein N0V90_012378 [Kalmusia sp. IMI 367209]
MLKLHDIDVTLPVPDDFEHSDAPAITFRAMTELCMTISKIRELSTRREETDIADITALVDMLRKWIEQLPAALQLYTDDSRRQPWSRPIAELHIFYFVSIILVYLLPGSHRQSTALCTASIVASSCAVRLYNEILHREEVSCLLAIHGWASLVAAVPQINCRVRHPAYSATCTEDLGIIRELLTQLGNKYPSAEMVLHKISDISQADSATEFPQPLQADTGGAALPGNHGIQAEQPTAEQAEQAEQMEDYDISGLFSFPDSFSPKLRLCPSHQLSEHIIPPPLPHYSIVEEPLGTSRKVHVVIIGAGASGINMLRTLRLHLPPDSWTAVAYEKNPRVGGTWYENRYPGCRCDIPAHNYQFSWRPNLGWTSFFAPAHEIEEYLEKTWQEESSRTNAAVIHAGHQVIGALWVEGDAVWKVTVEDLSTGKVFEERADFLLNASGILKLAERHFLGWKGSGCDWKRFIWNSDRARNSSRQVPFLYSDFPILIPVTEVKNLIHFVRSPTWIAPPALQTLSAGQAGGSLEDIDLDTDGNFSHDQIERFRANPKLYRAFVKAVEEEVNSRFPIVSCLSQIIKQESVLM